MALSTFALMFTGIIALVGINMLEKIDKKENVVFEN